MNNNVCPECGRDATHHKILFFLKERAYLGTHKPDGMPSNMYRKSEYDYGFDYYTTCRVKKKSCDCGNMWYEKCDIK